MTVPEGFSEIRLIDPFEIHVGPAYGAGDIPTRRYAFRVATHHCNLRGVVHGGMLMTFADLALGQAVWDVTDKAPSGEGNAPTIVCTRLQQVEGSRSHSKIPHRGGKDGFAN